MSTTADVSTQLLSHAMQSSNDTCADCNAPNPRWASWNIGVLICPQCAGVHRKIGTHISKVKSLHLDKWTPEQAKLILSTNNFQRRKHFEAKLPKGFTRPTNGYSLEKFIRDKYELNSFVETPAVAVVAPPPTAAATRNKETGPNDTNCTPEKDLISFEDQSPANLGIPSYDNYFDRVVNQIAAVKRDTQSSAVPGTTGSTFRRDLWS